MKVQLIGKKYHSNLEGLGFKPMFSCFFLSIICVRWEWRWRAHVEEARGGGGTWRRASDRVGLTTIIDNVLHL
jgi:hypothetical protein